MLFGGMMVRIGPALVVEIVKKRGDSPEFFIGSGFSRIGADARFHSQRMLAQAFALRVFAEQLPCIITIRHLFSSLIGHNRVAQKTFRVAKFAREESREKCHSAENVVWPLCGAGRETSNQELTGVPSPHLSLSVLFAIQPKCARLPNGGGVRKDLTRIGTLWTITRAPVPAFPCCDCPPLRIAGYVCEENRWRKKMQQKALWNSIAK